jgi:hypothetical protein
MFFFRHHGFVLLLTLMMFSLQSPRAHARNDDACEPYANIDIGVTPVFDNPAVNATLPLASIQQMARASANIIPHYDSVTLGVTHYEPVIEFRAPILERPLSDGSYCARVQRIDATIGYRNVTIFIANELNADPCSANHVMGHEQKHVAVNLALLQEYVPLIQKRLAEYLSLYGMFRMQTPEYANTLLREKANAILNDMSNRMLEENRRRQQLVDSPEEYARNNTVCGGRINEIVRRAVR